MTTQINIRYDLEPCSRCGGCGEFSYCESHGKVCFKCHGTGKQLTRAAKKAKKVLDEKMVRTYTRRVIDLVAGDVIRYAGRWVRVIEVPGLNGLVNKSKTGNGPWVESPQFEIKLKGLTYVTVADAEIQCQPTVKQWNEEMVPLARTLKGCYIEEKELI